MRSCVQRPPSLFAVVVVAVVAVGARRSGRQGDPAGWAGEEGLVVEERWLEEEARMALWPWSLAGAVEDGVRRVDVLPRRDWGSSGDEYSSQQERN